MKDKLVIFMCISHKIYPVQSEVVLKHAEGISLHFFRIRVFDIFTNNGDAPES